MRRYLMNNTNQDATPVYDDSNLVDSLIAWEGFIPTPTDIGDGKITIGSGLTDPKWVDLYRKRGNVWSEKDNRNAVIEETANRRRWAEENFPNWNELHPESQKALLSYKYNFDFNRRNSPAMYKAAEDRNWEEVMRQMDATSKDPKFKRGLEIRRGKERSWFMQGLDAQIKEPDIKTPGLFDEVTNAFKNMQHTGTSRQWGNGGSLNPWNSLSMREKADIMGIAVNGGVYDLDAIRGGYNEFARGGKIHIAPSKRGTFTAAAKRHGKSVQEFASQVLAHKGNYSPAMVKKANFARNASKWKHGLGGFLDEI